MEPDLRPGPRQRLASGNTSVLYADGEGRVLKVFDRDIPAHWAGLEADWTRRIHAAGVPAPAVIDLTEVDGQPAIVYERIEGPTQLSGLVARRADVTAVARELVDIQRRIHAIAPPPGLPRLRDRLATKIQQATGVDPAIQDRALTDLAGLPDGQALCHGDLHPGNIILTATGPVLIDWFDVAVGSPAADIARTSLLLRPRPTEGPPAYLPGSTNALLERFHAAYLRCHQELGGPTNDQRRRWEFVVAVARLCEPGHHDDLHGLLREASLPTLAAEG